MEHTETYATLLLTHCMASTALCSSGCRLSNWGPAMAQAEPQG